MKQVVDKHKIGKEIKLGDYVYLKLQPYRKSSVALRKHFKLNPRFYGLYKILRKIGLVAYKLELPEGVIIHLVFHVSLLE
jgi:hypothetical protein